MKEKTERQLKVGLCVIAFIGVIGTIAILNTKMKVNPTDHSVEQGQIQAYTKDPNRNLEEKDNQESIYQNVVLGDFKTLSYSEIMRICHDGHSQGIAVIGNVYSKKKTGDNIVYTIADDIGNYYSLIDASHGELPELSETDHKCFYGCPKGLSKINNLEIPQLNLIFIEEKNKKN